MPSMDKYEISIIIPTHNNEDYIARALSSCFEQDFDKPFEVIVLCDACTDKTTEIVKGFQKEHENLVVLEVQNKSALKNRIYGAKSAKGKYLMFLDGDDRLKETSLSTMYKTINKHNADLVNSSFYIERKKKTSKYAFGKDMILDRNGALKQLFHDIEFRGFMHCKIYKKELFLKMDILDKLMTLAVGNMLYEDLLVNFYYILQTKKVVNIKEPTYYYNKTNETSSTSKGYRRTMDNVMVRNLIRYKIEEINDEDVRKSFLKAKFRSRCLLWTDILLSKFPNKEVKKTIKSEVKHDFKNIFAKQFDVSNITYNQLIIHYEKK